MDEEMYNKALDDILLANKYSEELVMNIHIIKQNIL
jgi:hypothetical protein